MKHPLPVLSVALAALLAVPSTANAQVDLDLGGHFLGYGVFADQDDNFGGAGAAANTREFDLRRRTEIHFTGETTLDNGLTVGLHNELLLGDEAGAGDLNQTDETYVYVSGGFGRVNLGSEDGAAYLLQVAAPSADPNVDGLRTEIQAVNIGVALDYAHAIAPDVDRVTYLTPKFNGFQAGVSWAPEDIETNAPNALRNGFAGMNTDNDAGDFENLWEASARWDGEFEGVGISLGAGYSTTETEAAGGGLDGDYDVWNVGAKASFGAFSVGAAAVNGEAELAGGGDLDLNVWVVGADWTNGPWTAGASYYNADIDATNAVIGTVGADGDRITLGGGYAYGPGMTFRGSVSLFDVNVLGAGDEDATQVAIGTDISF